MARRTMSYALILLLCASVSASTQNTAAQTAEQTPRYEGSVDVRLQNLDVIVTDAKGNPVPGLSREDFVLLEEGVPQEITNFSIYQSSSSTLTIPDAGEPPAEVAETTETAPPRRFVFFIDEMSIQARAREKLKKSALELVRAMRRGDVATVVRPSAASRIVQDYTSDRELVEKSLSKAIDACKIRITAPAFRELQNLRRALERAENSAEIAAAKRGYVDAARGRVELRLGQIRALVTSMAGGEGKKILVLITSGLSAQPGREAYVLDEQIGLQESPKPKSMMDLAQEMAEQDAGLVDDPDPNDGIPALKPINELKLGLRQAQERPKWDGMERVTSNDFRSMIDSLARTAAAEGVTIYALEPEVPIMLSTTRGADSRTTGSTLLGTHASAMNVIPPEMLTQLLHNNERTISSLAEKTGGRWFRGVGSIADTFEQVLSDLEVYYSIAYRTDSEFTKPRRVEVAVRNRPELKVRTRTEVIDVSGARDMSGRVVAGLLYPREVDELAMTVKTEKPRKRGRSWEIPVEIVIPVEKIAFVRSAEGGYEALVSVHYATSRDDKEFVSYGRQEQRIALTERQFAALSKIRYRYASSITVPKKGDIRIAVGVMDRTSKLSSLETLSVSAR